MRTEVWWWSGFAGGAWICIVCLVVLLGSIVNFAVLVHWFTTKPTQKSPLAALPFVDLLVCALAAPLRYVSHFPFMTSPEKGLLPSPVNSSSLFQKDDASPFAGVNDGDVYDTENISLYASHYNDTDSVDDLSRSRVTNDYIHAAVVFICLMSLHVVVMVAVHRLALLMRCSLAPFLPIKITPPIFVLFTAVIISGSLVGGLHATGVFTNQLPLLGMIEYPPVTSPSPIVIIFLSYTAGLCGIAIFCYGTIITALLHQGRDRSAINSISQQDSQPITLSTTSSATAPQPSGEESTVLTYSGHGKAIRACMTVVSVLVTLIICWAIPISLALYALLTEAKITPALPYSDVLLLLSGLIHPFVYGEGWIALGACYTGIRHVVSTIACKIGLRKSTRRAVRRAVRDGRIRDNKEDTSHQRPCYCCTCQTGSRTPENQLFSEVTNFVNHFPLRNIFPQQEADPL